MAIAHPMSSWFLLRAASRGTELRFLLAPGSYVHAASGTKMQLLEARGSDGTCVSEVVEVVQPDSIRRSYCCRSIVVGEVDHHGSHRQPPQRVHGARSTDLGVARGVAHRSARQ
eukprot:scaffold3412_cov124-Isochrysis_galbana.AAC.9